VERAETEYNRGKQLLDPSETQGTHVPYAFLACALSEGKASHSPGFHTMRLSVARKEGI